MPIISPLRRPCTLPPLLLASPPLLLRQGLDVDCCPRLGPLKGERLRFAKMRPGEGGGAVPNAAPPSLSVEMDAGGPPARTSLMLLGKVEEVGVAGRTFILLCGDLATLCELICPDTVDTLGEAIEADDVDDALLCVWWWCGMLLILETDEDVDFRPRRPPEERRYEERGVSGAGEADSLRVEPEPWVVTRGRRGTLCVDGGGCV
jgi:hypothetical protein